MDHKWVNFSEILFGNLNDYSIKDVYSVIWLLNANEIKEIINELKKIQKFNL